MASVQYYFTITSDRDGYRGRFYGNYGRELIWWTEGYTSRQGAVNAIAILQRNAPAAPLI